MSDAPSTVVGVGAWKPSCFTREEVMTTPSSARAKAGAARSATAADAISQFRRDCAAVRSELLIMISPDFGIEL